MMDFINFLLNKVYRGNEIKLNPADVNGAFDDALEDLRYHFPNYKAEELQNNFLAGKYHLIVYLHRLSSRIYKRNPEHYAALNALSWIMKDILSAEVYYSAEIDLGFFVGHGGGLVIGSRVKIGKGFMIYQGCTIGHNRTDEAGAIIGDNVTLYTHAHIMGPVTIGDNSIIACNAVVRRDVPADSIFYSNSDIRSIKEKETKIS